MKKKIMTLLMAMAMVTAFCTSAFAAEIQPRAEYCGNCEVGWLKKLSVEYGSWNDVSSVQCPLFANKQDMVQEREVSTKYGCTYCDYEFFVETTETQTVCGH